MEIKRILIVDDEPLTRKSLYEILKHEGYQVFAAEDGKAALTIIQKEHPAIVISDLKMPQLNGLELLRQIKSIDSTIAVVLMTAYGSVESAVEAMREGAFDYITKPIIDSEIKIVIKRIFEQKMLFDENRFLKKRLEDNQRSKFHSLIGQNQHMQKIYTLIETIASTNAGVLIQGESGTGKRLIAQAIHSSDTHRHDKPFIEVSCGALPETLLESELFGHVKGAFTTAIKDRQGRFEAADGGTIFLDEIDTFSPKLQVKLLRVLQEGEFERVGDTTTIKVDARVIAATNQDLSRLIKEGSFREDLYYRLNVIPIFIPPLRMRKDDLPLLVEHFLKKCTHKQKKNIHDISEEVLQVLCAYDWPGNVRELENVMERAVIFCKGAVIEKEDLPDFLKELKVKAVSAVKTPSAIRSLKDSLKDSERAIVEQALRECKGNRKKTAQLLQINRTTLYNKMKELGLLQDSSWGDDAETCAEQ